jgi:ABC-2 type transport system ATP-binding protein
MIAAEKVTKMYGSFRAVDDLSFSIEKGEIVGLLGPNGAGKSTTMRMVTGFLAPSSGRVRIAGADIRDEPKAAKNRIGYLPESAPLYGDMMVEDYLSYVASMRGVERGRVAPTAEECGLVEVMHQNIAELSRGYRQRVGLAHALIHDPEILILDEPTSGLDPNQIIDVRKLIKEIGRTKTVVISTHILSEVEMLCGRVIIISRGRIVADGPTSELRARYGSRSRIRVQAGGCTREELVRALSALDGAASCSPEEGEDGLAAATLSCSGGADLRPAVFSAAVGAGWTLYELSIQRDSLEDVFRSLTAGGNEA